MQMNTANALGPTGWPVSAARLALISRPAFTPRSSAERAQISLDARFREFGIGLDPICQFVQQFARAWRIQLFECLPFYLKSSEK